VFARYFKLERHRLPRNKKVAAIGCAATQEPRKTPVHEDRMSASTLCARYGPATAKQITLIATLLNGYGLTEMRPNNQIGRRQPGGQRAVLPRRFG
jgi:hypothetical protein